MTSILTVYSRGRGFLGSCDARCYAAEMPSKTKGKMGRQYARGDDGCRCICGGANHAMGLTRAIRNRNRRVGLRLGDRKRFALRFELPADDLVVVDRLSIKDVYAARRWAVSYFDPAPLPLFAASESTR
jgi:hypothetical protein